MALTKVKGSGLATGAATASLVGIDDNATSTKLTVANTGIDVTGSVTCDELNVSTVGTNRVDISNTSLTDTGEMVSLQWDTNADFTIQGRDSAAGFKANWYRIEASASDGLADSHIWYTGTSAEAMRIDSAGNVTVKTGNLVIGTSGKGIDFSAVSDGSRSVSSNVLDDYETGTWTPVLDGHATTGTATYAFQVGIYTKVGRNVHVQGRINTTALGTIAGGLKITGLPFIINTTSGIFGSLEVGYAGGLALTAGQNVTGNADTGNTLINLRVWDATTGTGGLTSTQFSADGDIMFSMSYQTT